MTVHISLRFIFSPTFFCIRSILRISNLSCFILHHMHSIELKAWFQISWSQWASVRVWIGLNLITAVLCGHYGKKPRHFQSWIKNASHAHNTESEKICIGRSTAKNEAFHFFVNPNICVSDLEIMAQQMPVVYISGNGTSGVYEGLILKWVCLISINIWWWCAALMELIKITEIFIGTQTTLHRTPLNCLDVAHLLNCLLYFYI